jgi:hypothetical protein
MTENQELTDCPIHGLTDLSDHIGGKPCTAGAPSGAKRLSDLPIFGWAWSEDARDTES